MATQWLRRAGLLVACASALLLSACGGGGKIVQQLEPDRVIAFGDAMADLGQNGARYTVNDNTVNVWTQYVAGAFGRTITASAQGGLSYATGNARVAAKPDAAGNANTPTVQEQVTAFLGANSLGTSNLVLVNAGTSDVIVEARSVMAGTQSQDQMIANVDTAAVQLANEIKRLVDNGARHVAVAGPYNLGRSPWATQTSQGALLESASAEFNRKLKVALFNLNVSDSVLYVDAEFYYNLISGEPSLNSFDDTTSAVCTSIDQGPGIGTGNGKVNSNLCTPATIVTGANYAKYLWADPVYPTPKGQQLFGDYAYNQIRNRW